MTAPGRPAPGDQPAAGCYEDDADRWREAARLRRDCPGWIIIWLAPAREFHAYKRLPGTRRDTALAAATAADLAVLIGHAEQNTPPRSLRTTHDLRPRRPSPRRSRQHRRADGRHRR